MNHIIFSSGEHIEFSHSNITPIPLFLLGIVSCSPTSQYFDGNCQRGTLPNFFNCIPPQRCEGVPFDITNQKNINLSRRGFNLGMQIGVTSPHQPTSFLNICETDFPILSSPTCSPSIYVGHSKSQQSSQQWGEYYT